MSHLYSGTLPGWFTLDGAAAWSGLSESHIRKLISEGLVKSSNSKMPGNSKGRRLVNRESLNAYIESGVEEKPAK